ncbi:sugar-binding transcriptional regulator [Microlunatus parietis]|uniref:DNA-binding transcriptional regulator LsrR (DeoR family) n=1 Tax=Microlunatus parietis TaxID=682979 RepID=A0A7Y9I610_9ACTN|nr:sugar-binding domain-containing protein [Microlunatus parietis]NYE70923.1 DNA-binding transcriptional regulator LsrR (DeoR family) [Microlunatus parietis]
MGTTKRPGSTTPEGADETALMLAIARRYYREDQSKVDIARELGLSRFQVARLLQEARRTGLVRIEIGSPGHVDEELSTRVADRWDVPRVIVVEAHPSSQQATFDFIGTAVAAELERLVTEDAVIGLAWSRAAPAMARGMRRLPPCTVVQLSGAIYPPGGLPGSVEVTREVAAAAGGTAHILYAPLVVPDAETADGLRRQPEIAAALGRGDRLDVAVLSVGAWRSGSSAVYDLLPNADRRALHDRGVVGEVSGRVLDADGQAVITDLDRRVVGATLDQLRAAEVRLTTGSGAERRDAIVAAIRAGLVSTLVIDDALAHVLSED